MDRLSIPKLAHLETLTRDDLPRLIEQRQRVYEAMEDRRVDGPDMARLTDMMMWLTEQIVYCKALPFSIDTDQVER